MEACFLWLDPHVVEVLPKFGDTGGADPGLHVRAVEFFLEQLGIPPRLWAAYFLATLKGRTDAWQCLKFQAAVSFAEMRELFFGYFQAPSGFYSAQNSAVSSSCCLEPNSAMQEWSRALPALDRFEAPLPLDLAPEPSWSRSDHDPVLMRTPSPPPASQPPMHAVPTPSATPSPTFSYNSQQWSYPSQQIEQQQERSVWCIFCGKKGHKVEACWKKSRILQVQGAMTRQELDYGDDPSTSQQSLLTCEQPSVLPDELATDAIDLQVQAESGVDDVLEDTVDSDWLLGFFMDEFGPDSTVKDEQCTDLARAEGKDVLSSNLFDGDGQQIGELELLFGGADQLDALSFPAAEILQLGDGLEQPAAVFMPALSIRQLLQVHVSDIDRCDVPAATKRDLLSTTTRRCARNRLQQWLTDDELEEKMSARDRGKDLLRYHESRRRSLVEHPPASLKASARRKLRRRNRHHRFLQHPACSKVDALHRWMTDDELEHTRWRSVPQRPHPRSKDVLRRWLTDDEPEEIITLIQPREQDARQSWILDDELEDSEVTWLMVLMPSILGRLSTSMGTC